MAGYDDTTIASWRSYALTTVSQPVTEMANLGVDLLLERIEGRARGTPRHHRLASELVVRASTQAPPSDE